MPLEPEPVVVIVIDDDDALVATGLDRLLRIVATQTAMIKAISSKNRETR